MIDNKTDFKLLVTQINDTELMYLSENKQFFPKKRPEREARELHFLRIDEICFEDKAPRKEALENKKINLLSREEKRKESHCNRVQVNFKGREWFFLMMS